jgi:hypothetical protein
MQYGSDQAAGAGEYRDIGALDLVVELPKLDRRARAQVYSSVSCVSTFRLGGHLLTAPGAL